MNPNLKTRAAEELLQFYQYLKDLRYLEISEFNKTNERDFTVLYSVIKSLIGKFKLGKK